MGIGFSIAASVGLLIGLLMGMSRVVNSCLRSLFLGLQTLPTAAWVPVSLLIFGLSDHGIYFVIIMSSAPAVAIATSDGDPAHSADLSAGSPHAGHTRLRHAGARHPAGFAAQHRHRD